MGNDHNGTETQLGIPVKFESSQQNRAERLIAAGRLVLAAFALFAIWFDPSEPAEYTYIAKAVLFVFLAYSIGLAAGVWRSRLPRGFQEVIVHTIDLLVFVAIVFLTRGPTSPFFVFFTFSLVCAALRWQSKGTLLTTIVALTAVILMALFPTDLFREPGFELNRFIIRVAYLAVVGGMLAYLASHEQRLRLDLSRLTAWPRIIPDDIRALARESLEQTAAILGTRRVLLAWEEREEPWLHLAWWSADAFEYRRESPATLSTLVAEPLFGKSFFCQDTQRPRTTVVQDSTGAMYRWKGVPLNPDLTNRFDIRAVLALRLSPSHTEGYLFGFDKQGMTSDDLVLGGLIARQVSVRLDQFYLLQELRHSAAAEERVRLARDLHDGVLQSLTGVALQLETVQRLMQSEPDTARHRLEEIQHLIAKEQRDLRSHIRALKPSRSGPIEAGSTLNGRLLELAERIERQWGLHAEVLVNHDEIKIEGALAQKIYFLVHESMINAARHASASSVKADVSIEGDLMRITVVDDGRGFPFHGRFDHTALTEMNMGPVTLRERVVSMGGSLIWAPATQEHASTLAYPWQRKDADMPICLVLADDHPLILDGLENLFRLEQDCEVLARCTDGLEALQAVRRLCPDVLILDIRMPGKDGLAVAQQIRTEKLPTRVVLLTAAIDEDQLLEAIRSGVQGVVLKEMAPKLLVQCVRKVHAGEQWIERSSARAALEKMLRREATAHEIANLLTSREIEIVRMVAKGLRKKEIADKLSVSEGTVKVHLHNIYEKLKVDGRMALLRFAQEKGLA